MCTGISMKYPEGLVMGRTMDIEGRVPYSVIYQPRDYRCADNLLGGHFRSKYAIMGVGFHHRDPLKDGINEHGLIGLTNEFAGFQRYSKRVEADKLNISSYHFLTYILANYQSVDEVIADFDQIHVSSQDYLGQEVISPDFHYMLADGSQKCVVIEPLKGNLVLMDNPYGVMTNPPELTKHSQKLKELINLEDLKSFKGAKKLPGGYDPISRFIKAYYMKEMSLPPQNGDQAMSHLYSVLSALSLPIGFIPNRSHQFYTHTRYISAYDSKGRFLSIKDGQNPRVYQIGFDSLPNRETRQNFEIPQTFQTTSLLEEVSNE